MFQLKVELQGDKVLFEAWRGEESIASSTYPMQRFEDRARANSAFSEVATMFIMEVSEWIRKNTPIS